MSAEDRIEAAYAEETFKTTIADVRRRFRGPLRRHQGTLAMLLLVIVLAGAGVVVVSELHPSAAHDDRSCRLQWRRPTAMPPFVVALGGREGIRVYGSESESFYCIPASGGEVGGDNSLSRLADGPIGLRPDVAVFTQGGGPDIFYAGTVPAGTERVDFVSGHGPTWTAKLVGRYFVVALPAATTSYNITMSAQGGYGVVVVPGPILHPSPPPQFGADACAASTSELAAVPMLALYDPTASPTPKLRLVGKAPKDYLPDEVDLLAAPGIIAICRDGSTTATFKIPETDNLTVYGEPYEGAWAVGGRVPAGTTSVTVTLADGSTVPATVAGGYWLAWDSPDQTGLQQSPTRPVSVTALTPDGPVTLPITG